MSVDSNCLAVRDLIPEYAAGALDGRDRATVDAHLRSCVGCRNEADTYIEIADGVLALAPSAEPPLGFEAAVMNRIDRATWRQRLRAPRLLAAAAVVLALLGGVVGRVTAPAPTNALQTAALRTPDAQGVGTAFVHSGSPGWMYIDMTYRDWSVDSVRVEEVSDAGTVTPVGALTLQDGRGTLGVVSPVAVAHVRVIQMRTADGTIVCRAVLHA